jgi:hypothetical protein
VIRRILECLEVFLVAMRFLQVDVEGKEKSIIQSLHETLLQTRRIVRLHHRPGSDPISAEDSLPVVGVLPASCETPAVGWRSLTIYTYAMLY